MDDYPLFSTPQYLQAIWRTPDFEEYDRLHPDIWSEFKRITLDLIRRGVRHYGSKAVFEIIRYHRIINSTDGNIFKCNNNFTSCYARKFMQEYPIHKGFFEIREQKEITELEKNVQNLKKVFDKPGTIE